MPALSLTPPRFTAEEIGEVVGLYAGNPAYCRAAGEYDPEDIRADRVEADLREEAGGEGSEVLLARDERGRLVGLLCLLDRHPVDALPWIGLLMVHGSLHGKGVGRRLAELVEERFRREGRTGLRLAVLENNPAALAFWGALGWQEIDRRADTRLGRGCVVMHKQLA
ncbi:GNAT family N-acetyltransferase [Streptomyces cocklensis]|jgi:GNAT superfamily N-acetyltransferase|uniref:DNA mismatch repair protein MutT n=1 Tax=Actinacidiphila cocklensis TaxID=887465 RepID=A0A9W4DRU9_9ACTN|nr:GNAT family N-acetyltransferase [Actinacidiphila cocklensis]MDD1062905.1 GNAT family N-acetyltransferase [Actinacidiphila cocklensis]WSX78475.1 GNAT family N-acetyltransferase [Streptomyces sp. NBC_00899]CAG6394915.1 DNA mismatch repair protein MutT [Actinacidiphila cocklensis]